MSCSNPEAQKTEEVKYVRPRRQVPPGMCNRCREAKSQYKVRSIALCRRCFEGGVNARLVRCLHPPLLPTERQRGAFPRPSTQSGAVLVALSGGAGSTALLELLHTRDYFPNSSQRPPVWQRAVAVHVDFSSVTDTPSQVDHLREFAETRGIEFVGLSAEDVFDPELRARLGVPGVHAAALGVDLAAAGLPLEPVASSSAASPLDQLQALLAALPPPSRPALLSHILESLLSTAAGMPGIAHLLVGETSTREAQRVISGTASGRGWSLPLELARARTLPSASGSDAEGVPLPAGVVRIKAIKELSLKEAALWCHARGLETANERRWDSTVGGARRDARGKGTIASIEALTERFIATLNVSHPSTVTTINKTGDKLRFTGDEGGVLCPVCQLPVDPSALEWKAQASLTSLDHQPGLSTAPSTQLPVASPPTGAHDSESTRPELAPLLCYGCLTTFTPLSAAHRDQPASGAVPLPLWVGERVEARQPMSRADMHAQVADFLLE